MPRREEQEIVAQEDDDNVYRELHVMKTLRRAKVEARRIVGTLALQKPIIAQFAQLLMKPV